MPTLLDVLFVSDISIVKIILLPCANWFSHSAQLEFDDKIMITSYVATLVCSGISHGASKLLVDGELWSICPLYLPSCDVLLQQYSWYYYKATRSTKLNKPLPSTIPNTSA